MKEDENNAEDQTVLRERDVNEPARKEDGGSGERRAGEDRVASFEEIYQEVALNCFRYLGFKGFDEVDRLTIAEYELLMKATELREADIDYRLHMQAFLNVQAGAKKKAGKNKEVRVQIACSSDMAMQSAKTAIREELAKEGEQLSSQLDAMLGL